MKPKPISWHEACLKSRRQTLANERASLELQRQSVERLIESVWILEAQIDRAKREGKAAFDPDKYLPK
jgi:hypothetical protein